MEKKHHHVVAAVIVDKDEVLCMQRGQTKFEYTSFKWEFPGGKIEPGETPAEALHREILEEMAMDVRVGKHLVTVEHEYPDFRITMAAYLCTSMTGRAFTMNEHHAYKWLSFSQLSSLEWVAADIGIVEAITTLSKPITSAIRPTSKKSCSKEFHPVSISETISFNS